MNIEMDLVQARLQAESIREMCQNQFQAYEQLQSEIQRMNLTITRHSPVYESAGKYFVAVLIPLVKGATLLSELILEANIRFVEEYIEKVDECNLRSSELEEQIKLWDLQISTSQMRLKQLAVSSMDVRNKAFQISENMTILGTYGGIKAELKQKLEKLVHFHNSSAAIFDKIYLLNAFLEQGYKQARCCWNEQTAQFITPSQSELIWAEILEYCYYIRKKRNIKASEVVLMIKDL